MAASREELRNAVGHALRRVRESWKLSLDDVEQASGEHGVRITRSHLSRVENGQADLALPRFLALMRAVGEPASGMVESLDALLDPAHDDGDDLESRGRAALAAHDAATAARLLRRAARGSAVPLARAALFDWARAEAALGRWQAAAHAFRLALARDARPGPATVLRLAVSALGSAQPGLALALVRGLDAPGGTGALVAAAARLESGDGDEAPPAEAAPPLSWLGLILRSEARRRSGQPRAARTAAEQALAGARTGVVAIEAALAAARADGDMRRPAAGLHALDRARALARATGIPDLLARAHLEAERLHKLNGDRTAARDAGRAARAIARRHQADAAAPRSLPLHGLFLSIDGT